MFAVVLAAAAAASSLFPPAGSYSYTAAMNGQPIGKWAVTVKSGASSTEVNENSAASIMGMSVSATAALMLGPDLAPTLYDGRYRTSGQAPTATVTLTPNSATVVSTLAGQPAQIALMSNTRHFVVIEPGLLAGLFVLPAQLGAWKDDSVTWITPTTASAQTIAPSRTASQSRPSAVPAQDVLLSFDQPVAISIWYDPRTLVPDQIAVPSQSAVLTRVR